MISVVIPTYQHAGTIGACLDSILSQTLPPDEIIVVNDGSTDNTSEILQVFQTANAPKAGGCYFSAEAGDKSGPRKSNTHRLGAGQLRKSNAEELGACAKVSPNLIVINQENRGAQAARNRGWKEAKGDLLIFCDADVRMHPDMLEKLANALAAHPEASYAYGAFRFGWKKFGGVQFSADRLRERNFIHTSSLIRAADFPGFDESIKRLQDWDVWLTMLEAGKIGTLVNEVLCDVAIDGKSRIGSSWLPRFMYRIPWGAIGWMPESVRRYREARAAIAKKHHLL